MEWKWDFILYIYIFYFHYHKISKISSISCIATLPFSSRQIWERKHHVTPIRATEARVWQAQPCSQRLSDVSNFHLGLACWWNTHKHKRDIYPQFISISPTCHAAESSDCAVCWFFLLIKRLNQAWPWPGNGYLTIDACFWCLLAQLTYESRAICIGVVEMKPERTLNNLLCNEKSKHFLVARLARILECFCLLSTGIVRHEVNSALLFGLFNPIKKEFYKAKTYCGFYFLHLCFVSY